MARKRRRSGRLGELDDALRLIRKVRGSVEDAVCGKVVEGTVRLYVDPTLSSNCNASMIRAFNDLEKTVSEARAEFVRSVKAGQRKW